jgi:hypothetical protein
MKKNVYKIFALIIAMGLFITACDNVDVTEDTQLDAEATNDAALTAAAITDAFAVVNGIASSTTKATLTCGTYVFESNTMTITYPEEGCTEDNGLTKSGVVTAVLSGSWGVGATVTITFDGYTVNDKALTGTITVSYEGADPYPTFDLTASSMSLTFEGGKSITWNSEKTFTWMDGYATLADKSDDQWEIDGTASGVTRGEENFTRVETDLLTSPTCKWFVDGTIDLTVGDNTYNMAFGPSCGAVTFTYKGITIQRTFD